MATIPSRASSSGREPTSRDDDQNYEKDEVDDFHHFMKHRHHGLDDENADADENAGNPGTEKGSEASSVKELCPIPLAGFVRMRVGHPDKLPAC